MGLVPGGELQRPQAEVAERQRAVHEALVPARLHRLLHRLCPPLGLITAGQAHRQLLARGLATGLATSLAPVPANSLFSSQATSLSPSPRLSSSLA